MRTRAQLGNRIRPEYVFIVFAVVFGMVSCFLLPPVAGLDEHTQIARVEQLANLNLFSEVVKPAEDGNPEKALWGGQSDTALWTYAVEYITGAHEGLKLFAEPISLESAGDWAAYGSSGKTVAVFSHAAVNTPVVYLPHIVGFALARLFTSSVFILYMAMRVCGFVFYVCVGFFAIRKTPLAKWPLTVFLLFPSVMIPALCVTADTVTDCIILMFAVSLLALISGGRRGQTKKADWILVSVCAILLAFVKASYLPLVLLVVLVPMLCPELRTKRVVAWAIVVILASSLLFALWFFVAIKPVNPGVMWGRAGISPSGQVAYVVSHPFEFLAMVFSTVSVLDILQISEGYFVSGYRGVLVSWSLPLWAYLLPLIASFFLVDDREDRTIGFVSTFPKIVLFFFVSSAMCYLLICAALYVSFTEVGYPSIEGLQERYYVPFTFLLLMSISMFASWVTSISAKREGSFCRAITNASNWMYAHALVFQIAIIGMLLILSIASTCYLYAAYAL